MKLTIRDRILAVMMALGCAAYAGYQFLWTSAAAKNTELRAEKIKAEGLAADITPLLEQSEKLEKEKSELASDVEDIKKNTSGFTASKEEFLVFLGDTAKENNVAVTGFTDLGLTETNGIYRAVFDIELKGSAVDLNNVLRAVNGIGIKLSVGSVSYRQQQEYGYLKRFFDEMTDLSWYIEPEEKTDEEKQEQEELPEEPEPTPPISNAIPENPPDISNWEQEPEPETTPAIPPTPTSEPEPSPTPTPSPAPEEREENIKDRLDRLLEQTGYSNTGYSVIFLTGNEQAEDGTDETIRKGQDMRLAVTVCLTMFNPPSDETSFMNRFGERENAVL